ncbi:hypothetical protein [Streptomyces shenzhenensis]|uniref:hypothetical protein n=1 Tax=Streptomyces shenzhenensis TaxID=943815 RepID=UPI0016054407|nr:hypothetical protein [Streptomyces shenzhenensis]
MPEFLELEITDKCQLTEGAVHRREPTMHPDFEAPEHWALFEHPKVSLAASRTA